MTREQMINHLEHVLAALRHEVCAVCGQPPAPTPARPSSPTPVPPPARRSVPEKLALRPAEAAETLGISRSKLYALMARGEVPTIRIGKSLRVPMAALRERLTPRPSR